MLGSVIGVLWICLECDFGRAQCANLLSRESKLAKYHKQDAPFDIEPEYLDTVVILSFHRLLSSVELLAFVNIFSTSITSPIVNVLGMRSFQSKGNRTWRKEP